tara:strand:+ start:204 stop:518 length:315 start_codon:yes stop_codon:yes gene_type:complete
MHDVALKIPLAALAVGGLFQCHDAGAAGIAVFGNVAAAGTLALLIWDKTDPRLLVIWLAAIGAVTAGLRHSDLAGGQQDARMLFENLARTDAYLDTIAQTPPTP